MKLRRTVRSFTHCSSLALAAALAVPVALALPGAANAQAAGQSFSIPAGDLAAALQAFSAQTGMQLVYSSDLVAGKRSPGVSGEMSAQEALGRLLAGTGLSARVSGNTATLVQEGPAGEVGAAEGERLLGPVRVEGSQSASGPYQPPVRGEGIAQLGGIRGAQDEEAVGYRAMVASITTGAPIPIEDIPRSITVQTQEQIEKQDVTNLTEALQRMPGITIQDNGSQAEPRIFSRGYRIEQYQVEGGPARSFEMPGTGLQNLDAFERVELVRGPNALTTGEGSPGGSINLIRKRPGPVESVSLKVEAGSFGRYGVVGDFSTPSILGSSIAFRGIASFRNEGEEFENFNQRSFMVSGLFDAPLGENARLEFGLTHSRSKVDGANLGEFRYFDGPLIDLPRNINIADKSLGQRTDSTEIFSKLYVDVAEDWDFELGTFYSTASNRGRTALPEIYLLSVDDPDEVFFTGSISNIVYNSIKSDQLGVDAKLTGRFDTFGIGHDVLISASYNAQPISNVNNPGSYVYSVASISTYNDLIRPIAYNPVSGNFPTGNIFEGRIRRNLSIVLGDTINWQDKIMITAVARRDVIENDFVSAVKTSAGTQGALSYSTRAVTPVGSTWRPTFAVAVKPTKNLNIYASYADGFNRQDDRYMRTGEAPDFTYTPLAPATYQNKEIGIKYATGKWLFSGALYRIDEKDRAFGIGDLDSCPPARSTGALGERCYVALPNSNSKGFDLELSGEIAAGLNVTANFNYNKAHITPPDLPDLQQGDTFLSPLPVSAGSVFIDWRPRFLDGVAFQLGGRYRSRIYETGTRQEYDADHNPIPCPGPDFDCSFEYSQKSYFVFDFGFDYQVSDKLALRLFVENFTDTIYLSTVSPGITGNFYGRPRSFMASLKWTDAGSMPEGGRSLTNGLAPFGNPADWYASFGIGYAAVSAMNAKADGKSQDGISPVIWDFHTKTRPTQIVNLGYRISDNFRFELEAGHRLSPFSRIGGNAVAPFGVCGIEGGQSSQEPFNCDDVPGDVESWSLMANAIYDFGKRDAVFRPYVGGGLGLSRYSIGFQGKMDGIGGTGRWAEPRLQPDGRTSYFLNTTREAQEFVGARDTSLSFAWQAIAGTSLKLNSRLDLDVGYRYFSVPGMNWRALNLATPTRNSGRDILPLTPALGSFKANYVAHSLTVGMRWAFGGRKN